MFANVVRARVLQDAGEGGKEVAIKIIRSQESMSVSLANSHDFGTDDCTGIALV